MIAFSVPGLPQGKGRARVGKIAGHARLFTPAKTVAYEGLIAHAAQQAMQGAAPFDCAVALDMVAVFPIPESWSKKKREHALSGALFPTVKPDLDNIEKAIGDGGNGVLWVDDKQIVHVIKSKRYGPIPGVWVRVGVACLPALPVLR